MLKNFISGQIRKLILLFVAIVFANQTAMGQISPFNDCEAAGLAADSNLYGGAFSIPVPQNGSARIGITSSTIFGLAGSIMYSSGSVSQVMHFGSTDFNVAPFVCTIHVLDPENLATPILGDCLSEVSFTPREPGMTLGALLVKYNVIPSEEFAAAGSLPTTFYYCFDFIGNVPIEERDLTPGPITIPEAKLDPSNGFPVIPVNTPTLINVPVSISFTTPLTAAELSTFVPVTLQAGSQTYNKSISIANLVANGNSMVVPFMVTFEPIDVGLKTLIATVNPANTFKESNFANNSSQLAVHVGRKYKLVKEVTINGVRQNSDFVSTAPSRLAGCNSTKDTEVKIKVKCLKDDGSEEQVEGCELYSRLDWANKGPHIHDDGSTEHLGSLSPLIVAIPESGIILIYKVSEFAGRYAIDFAAQDPEGESLSLNSVIVEASIANDLTPLNDLLVFDIDSHPDDGFYATPLLRDRLSLALAQYRTEVIALNKTLEQVLPESLLNQITIPVIESEGASLSWGGGFDVNKNWKADSSLWKTIIDSNGKPKNLYNGHCLHRNGQNIDISMSPFNSVGNRKLRAIYKEKLSEAFNDSKLIFPEKGEKPTDSNPSHWHAKPK